jgi:rRNA biogenesis protein RRP5
MEDAQPAKSVSKATVPALQLGGFKWGHQTEPDTPSSPLPSDDEDDEDNGVQTKGRKKRRKHEIAKDMTAEMHTKAPESTADFERLLLGSPNSSFLWLQYMSFQLQLSEVEKAREIGRRALSAINFREEQEKLNVWIALLNLENSYGTDESLETVFKDAARHNDSKGMHLRLCTILDQTGKHEVR